MVVVGALVRLEIQLRDRATQLLDQLEGVSTFSIGERGRIGVIVEADSIRAAHARLTEQIQAVPGVLAVWPVFAHYAAECADRDAGQDLLARAAFGGESDE